MCVHYMKSGYRLVYSMLIFHFRQLNMYNFHKVEDHPHSANKSMEFKNPYFLPGRKDLLKKIHRRKTVKRSKEEDDDGDKPSPKEATLSPQSPQVQHILFRLC